jgi:HPt (histidine-containing phosphotransfer) domain-containing protein
LTKQAADRDWGQLTRTAHQLKGAAGSYGFHALTSYAARLEHAAKDAQHEESILEALHELLDVCQRVRPGMPDTELHPQFSIGSPSR